VIAYVAGPMRGLPGMNFPAFDECAAWLRSLSEDWEVFSPAERDRSEGFDPTGLSGFEDLDDLGFDLAAAFRDDLDFIVSKATHLVLLPGWASSEGARLEREVALACGKEVRYYRRFPTGVALHRYPDEADRVVMDRRQAHEVEGLGPQMGEWDIAFLRQELHKEDPTTHLPTGAERYLNDRLADPEYKAAYDQASTEVRVTSSTGGQKGQKPVQMSLVPVEALEHISLVYAHGAEKYARENWRKGYEWHLSYDALQRHLMRFWDGEDVDHDSGLLHLAHAAFHINTLIVNLTAHPEMDDRP
jgi:hypothetical protein